MMNAPSGPTSREPFAHFDLDGLSWRTFQTSLFSENLPEQSVIWPRAGMTRSGYAYALPMSVRAMAANGCSYLPTPWASDGTKGGPN